MPVYVQGNSWRYMPKKKNVSNTPQNTILDLDGKFERNIFNFSSLSSDCLEILNLCYFINTHLIKKGNWKLNLI